MPAPAPSVPADSAAWRPLNQARPCAEQAARVSAHFLLGGEKGLNLARALSKASFAERQHRNQTVLHNGDGVGTGILDKPASIEPDLVEQAKNAERVDHVGGCLAEEPDLDVGNISRELVVELRAIEPANEAVTRTLGHAANHHAARAHRHPA